MLPDSHAPTIVQQGLIDYLTCWQAMRTFTAQRQSDTPDQIWLAEHPPVYTLGQAADPTHLLDNQRNIPVIRTDRGGQITYHGPGQLIAYVLLDLKRRHLFVRTLVWRIEQAVLETLTELGIAAERHCGQPGIYLQQNSPIGVKIAALGLKISRGCSYHGLALNVAMDCQPFTWINPCGQQDLTTIDLYSLGVRIDWADIQTRLVTHLLHQLALPTETIKENG
ncbi:MAG: lipoyl(octanoyl) transferase LipB [Ottowia sp.]|nr:lipoyl(octanoyl) transferase LipB [Ottowia sp.]